ncbi:alpha/beta hydrolase family protein [Pseudonocardia bannensis]|uniref:Alpha/beta hydrolase n=1 Tax=Pseudonocardia bannensis TaxID=630973 RepID=A0A848DPF0_9PSEU|nr:alpha/beta family hydrolase [Pseudonocardia bannensis]NMH94720.1 alpha/beta hydrolase [Pseudonocardia bannensis]
MGTTEIDTPHGPARVHLHRAPGPARAALLLGHGAGGGVGAVDLAAATSAALAAGLHVALVEQPYRVAGRRAPAPARQLDAAWLDVVAALAAGEFRDLPLIFGGRSSGARVACRTAAAGGAAAVLCLAFPVHPPGKPEKHRRAELDGVTVPVLIVQGERDAFGRPDEAPGRELVLLAGDHALKADPAGAGRAVGDWLDRLLSAPGSAPPTG